MNKFIILIGICSAVASGSKLAVPHKECEKIVGCFYLTVPEPIKNKYVLSIKDINASLCTHIYAGSIAINADASVELNVLSRDGNEFKKFKDFQKKNKNLKILVSMWQGWLFNLNIISTNPHLLEKFSNNVVDFVKKYDLNGIEIDLKDDSQIDAQSNGSVSNQQNFVVLLKALREKFDKVGLILCVTVGAREASAKMYDIKGVSKYVNFINLKTFDFHDSLDKDMKVGHNAPMYPSRKENAEERKLNIDYVVKYWISKGAPPNKIILGTAFHGSAYTLANPKLIGRGAPFNNELGTDGFSGGVAPYFETCPLEKNPQWKHLYDEEQQVPYMYNGNQIIGYNNAESIAKKAKYVKKMNLGGAMVWGIEEDDFNGQCGEKFPLLKTLNRVLKNRC